MSGLTGTNYPLCMYVCQSVRVFDGPARDTYDNTAVSDSSGVWEWLFWSWMTPFLLIARLYFFIFCFCLRFQLRVCSHPTHCASSALQCGTEKWRDRRREWTDVTVSRCRSSQTLTHFHSAHHKRPAVFICLGAVPVSSGRVTFSRGVGFHCLPLTRARPQLPVCAFVCWRGFMRGHIRMCGFCTAEKWNCRSPRDSTILSLSAIRDRKSSVSRTAASQARCFFRCLISQFALCYQEQNLQPSQDEVYRLHVDSDI